MGFKIYIQQIHSRKRLVRDNSNKDKNITD